MTVKFVYKIIPIFVFYTNMFVWKGKAGTAYGIFIFIRPDSRFDHKLLEHELIHCRTYIKTLSISGWLYMLSEKWRVKYEAEAYLKTLGTGAGARKYIIKKIYYGYNIKRLTQMEVEKIINDYTDNLEKEKEISL